MTLMKIRSFYLSFIINYYKYMNFKIQKSIFERIGIIQKVVIN